MDGMEMETAVARRVFDLIAAAGEELAAGWRAAMAMVDAGEAGIGADRLAVAFRSGYADRGARVREMGAAHPGRMASDAGVGHASADDYLGADVRNQALLGGIAGGALGRGRVAPQSES